MSVYCGDGEPVDVYTTKRIKARVEHRCSACKETISPGHTYHLVTIIYDGEVESTKRCGRCQAIFAHLLERCRYVDEEYPDERLNCGHEYKERWGEEPPPEVAALAFALPGEVQGPK